jgi:hypothetical protein
MGGRPVGMLPLPRSPLQRSSTSSSSESLLAAMGLKRETAVVSPVSPGSANKEASIVLGLPRRKSSLAKPSLSQSQSRSTIALRPSLVTAESSSSPGGSYQPPSPKSLLAAIRSPAKISSSQTLPNQIETKPPPAAVRDDISPLPRMQDLLAASESMDAVHIHVGSRASSLLKGSGSRPHSGSGGNAHFRISTEEGEAEEEAVSFIV